MPRTGRPGQSRTTTPATAAPPAVDNCRSVCAAWNSPSSPEPGQRDGRGRRSAHREPVAAGRQVARGAAPSAPSRRGPARRRTPSAPAGRPRPRGASSRPPRAGSRGGRPARRGRRRGRRPGSRCPDGDDAAATAQRLRLGVDRGRGALSRVSSAASGGCVRGVGRGASGRAPSPGRPAGRPGRPAGAQHGAAGDARAARTLPCGARPFSCPGSWSDSPSPARRACQRAARPLRPVPAARTAGSRRRPGKAGRSRENPRPFHPRRVRGWPKTRRRRRTRARHEPHT